MVSGALVLRLFLAAGGAWQPAAPGVETLTVDEGGASVSLIRFDLQRFRPEVVMLGPGRTKTVAALRRDLSAVAPINGGVFPEDPPPARLPTPGGQTQVPPRPRVGTGVAVILA